MEVTVALCKDHIEVLKDSIELDSFDSIDQQRLRRLFDSGVADFTTMRLIKDSHHLHRLFLCDILKSGQLLLPSLPSPPPRNPELEARIQRYKAEQVWCVFMIN